MPRQTRPQRTPLRVIYVTLSAYDIVGNQREREPAGHNYGNKHYDCTHNIYL